MVPPGFAWWYLERKKATKNYTVKYFKSADKLYLWLEKKFIPARK